MLAIPTAIAACITQSQIVSTEVCFGICIQVICQLQVRDAISRTIEGMAVMKAELALGAAPGAIPVLLEGPASNRKYHRYFSCVK